MLEINLFSLILVVKLIFFSIYIFSTLFSDVFFVVVVFVLFFAYKNSHFVQMVVLWSL